LLSWSDVSEDVFMARPKKLSSSLTAAIPDEEAGPDPELVELAEERHNLNVMVTTETWEMLREAAELQLLDSVSDLVRGLIDDYLEEHENRGHLEEVTMQHLREELDRRRKRSRIRVKVS
jgi:hypothetical protein